MTPHHHEPDHLPGEPRPGAGILSLRLVLYGVSAWALLAALIIGGNYVL